MIWWKKKNGESMCHKFSKQQNSGFSFRDFPSVRLVTQTRLVISVYAILLPWAGGRISSYIPLPRVFTKPHNLIFDHVVCLGHTKVKEPSLPLYLPWAGEKIVHISFPRVLVPSPFRLTVTIAPPSQGN